MSPEQKKHAITAGLAVLGLLFAIALPFIGLGEGLSAFIGVLIVGGGLYGVQIMEGGGTIARLAKLEEDSASMRADLEETRNEVAQRADNTDAKSEKVVSELQLLQTLLGQVIKKGGNLGTPAKPAPKKAPSAQKAAPQKATTSKTAPEKTTSGTAQKSATEKAAVGQSATKPVAAQEAVPQKDVAAMAPGKAVKKPPVKPAEKQTQDLDDVLESLSGDEVYEDDYDDEDGYEEEVIEEAPAAKQGARQAQQPGSKKPTIRLIKREDQLLSVIQNSLADNRVDLYLQKIVGLPSRRTSHYECFSRVRDEDGRIVLPRQYIKVAEARGLIGTIDNLLLFRLIQLVRRLGPRRPDIRFFCNLSVHSMNDEEFFPQFIDFMSANEEFSNRLVFEIAQADYEGLDDLVKDQLLRLGKRGFGFSLDHSTKFDEDILFLSREYFKFMKTDIQYLTKVMDANEIRELVSDLRNRGISLVASRLENEEMVLQSLDGQIEYAQGYLFGEPMPATDLNREL